MDKLLKKFRLYVIFVFIFAIPHSVFSQTAAPFVGNFCISQDEMILYNMLNDLRRQNNLASIPLSKSLCVVARIHIDDLITSRPQEKGCSLNSWSTNGKWTPCCSGKDPIGMKCMNAKPREITGYTGLGYELVYWEEKNVTPGDAVDLWQQTNVSGDMILNREKWQSKKWKAMGVGLKNGYAIVWLGDKTDILSTIKVCGTDSSIRFHEQKTISAATKPEQYKEAVVKAEPNTGKKEFIDMKPVIPASVGSFYVIIASAKTQKLATEAARNAEKKGISDITIIGSDDKFRVSAGSFTDEKSALTRIKELRSHYADAWLLRHK